MRAIHTLGTLLAGWLFVGAVSAQTVSTLPTTPPPPPSNNTEDEGLTVRGSSVGYIDTAVPGNQILFRGDFGYRFPFPNRAEFFYPQSRPGGPGLPKPERSVDFQDVTAVGETLLGPRTSIFVETGARFLNPEINLDTAGWGDTSVGIKHALYADDVLFATAQLRTTVPTGDNSRGLGTGHVSLEPGLLGFWKLTDRLGIASEFRYWIPVGGTDFAGGVLRYGLGFRYTVWNSERVAVTPTAEFIGWTVLGGKQSRVEPNDSIVVQSAAGATIVNAKVGARVDFGERLGTYIGLGHALTGETWYQNELRVEVRWVY
jgi:hypothetical protein